MTEPNRAPTPAEGPSPGAANLSGPPWCIRFPTSREIGDLVSPFREGVARFVEALRANGATVSIAATLRPKERAFLMHWSWRIARKTEFPTADPFSLGIIWDHGDEQRSVAAARAMVERFGIAPSLKVPPALTSRHVEGKAIDMTITRLPPVLVFEHQGETVRVEIPGPPNGADNQELHRAAKKFFAVVKANPGIKDPPPWSTDGRGP